jgi:hypothetical protein
LENRVRSADEITPPQGLFKKFIDYQMNISGFERRYVPGPINQAPF